MVSRLRRLRTRGGIHPHGTRWQRWVLPLTFVPALVLWLINQCSAGMNPSAVPEPATGFAFAKPASGPTQATVGNSVSSFLFPVSNAGNQNPETRNWVKNPVANGDFVGDEACRSCHQHENDTYYGTAHHLTSQIADKNSVLGTFNEGANILRTANPNLFFRMDANDSGFFQTAMWGTAPNTWSRTERIDLVIGSGGKGQSYLFWNGDELFQLPVGYSTILGQWINSPGYRDGTANFERPIIPRCLECHATYFRALEPLPSGNRYDTTDFVLGVSCERCHGAGREHVAHYRAAQPPAGSDPSIVKSGIVNSAIVNPAKLSRDRQFEVCSQCHGGQGVRELLPAFSYVPGQPLANYIDLGPVDTNADIDVHGKQVVLLAKSRCFQSSSNMSCATCHDVHEPERNLATFSQRCLTCHKIETCGVYPKLGPEIASNCIDCHMPNQESKVVFLDVNGKKINPQFRTHWIKVYPPTPAAQPQ
jgi:Cytochrome c554 and c-prime